MKIAAFVAVFCMKCYGIQFGQKLGRKMFERFHHGLPVVSHKPKFQSFDQLTFMFRKHAEFKKKLTKTPAEKRYLKYLQRYLHTIGNENLYRTVHAEPI